MTLPKISDELKFEKLFKGFPKKRKKAGRNIIAIIESEALGDFNTSKKLRKKLR